MGLFFFTVATVLIVWAICSLAEASVYAVGMPYVRQLEKENSAAGRILRRFKENMERPISAILIVNTVVAAAGASVAGASVAGGSVAGGSVAGGSVAGESVAVASVAGGADSGVVALS